MNNPRTDMTRRNLLKTLGAGAAVLGLGSLATQEVRAEQKVAATTSTPQPFTLPPLGYAYDALEPHFDARTMEIHHTKHHQAYINNANAALKDQAALAGLSAEALLRDLAAVPETIRTTVRNNVGGHVNHSFFWQLLKPGAGGKPSGALAEAITAELGGFDKFRTEFDKAAMTRFGSGWAWLSVKGGKLVVHSTANQDSPLSEGAIPVIGLDVWEHAYYLKYQNRRAEFVAAFWQVIDWEKAGANYAAAIAG